MTKPKSSSDVTPKIVAVMPAYNEALRIGQVIELAKQHVHEVIVVNDCSQDHTAEVAQQAGAWVVNLAQNGGAGFATREGCLKAIERGASVLVTIDSDGQHDAREIAQLVQHLLAHDLDIVFGGRPRTPNMPFENRFGNNLLSTLSRWLFGVQVNDTLTGFHVIKAEAFPQLCWESNRYSFVSEIVYRVALHRLRYAELPVSTIYHDNKKGMRKRDGLKTLVRLLHWKIKTPKARH